MKLASRQCRLICYPFNWSPTFCNKGGHFSATLLDKKLYRIRVKSTSFLTVSGFLEWSNVSRLIIPWSDSVDSKDWLIACSTGKVIRGHYRERRIPLRGISDRSEEVTKSWWQTALLTRHFPFSLIGKSPFLLLRTSHRGKKKKNNLVLFCGESSCILSVQSRTLEKGVKCQIS